MVAAGTHDPELLLTARGHDMAGGPLVESFLSRMTNSKKLHKLTRVIVEQHMQPYQLTQGEDKGQGAKKGAFVRLHNKMAAAGGDLKLIAHQCQCDACATGADWKTRSLASGAPNWEHRSSQRALNMYDEIISNKQLAKPLVQGRDLIAAGLKPGPTFGKILKEALDIQYSDITLTKEDILKTLSENNNNIFV